MHLKKTISVLLPARNEAQALPEVLKAMPPEVDRVLVLDNGSTDLTAQVAREWGAEVVTEPRAGYGRACLAGMTALKSNPPDVIAFADADGSDDLSTLMNLVDPIVKGDMDLALAQRIPEDPHALTFQQRFGNWLATRLIYLFWGHDYRDLGPMRVIKWKDLQKLDMRDTDYGWTVEMQLKALISGLRIKEYPTPYKRRTAGCSKVSRNMIASIRAGIKILWVIGRETLRHRYHDLT